MNFNPVSSQQLGLAGSLEFGGKGREQQGARYKGVNYHAYCKCSSELLQQNYVTDDQASECRGHYDSA
jgi:hypothetical protein